MEVSNLVAPITWDKKHLPVIITEAGALHSAPLQIFHLRELGALVAKFSCPCVLQRDANKA